MSHPAPIRPEGILEGIRPGAVLRGFLLDNVLTIAIALVLVAAVLDEGLASSSAEEIDAVFASTRFALLLLPLGLLCTVLGGCVAGSHAGIAHVKNGVAVGVADVALALISLLVPPTGPEPPLWIDLLGFGLVLPAAAAGGALARRFARSAPGGGW
jgi:hypothetical protein